MVSNHQFRLIKLFSPGRKFVEIDEEEFNNIKQAREIMSAALSLEEVYDYFVSNLRDFEKELLIISVDEMLLFDFSHNNFYSISAAIGRRLANLLSSARSYFDQAPSLFAECASKDDSMELAKRIVSAEYDAKAEYRVMEALRNHVQHKDVGVLSHTFGGYRDPVTGHQIFSVAPTLLGRRLLENKKTKALVRPDIKEKMDLRLLVRAYAESISKIHGQLRSESKESVERARKVVDECFTKNEYGPEYGSLGHLGVEKLISNKVCEKFYIVTAWDDTRQWLVSRNSVLWEYSKHYVTGKIDG